jgi:hypothetical protein
MDTSGNRRLIPVLCHTGGSPLTGADGVDLDADLGTGRPGLVASVFCQVVFDYI